MRYLVIIFLAFSMVSCKKEDPQPTSNAIFFESYNSYIEVSDHPSLNPPYAITAIMWVHLPVGIDCDLNNNWRSLVKKFSPGNTIGGYELKLEEDLSLTWNVATAGGLSQYSGGTLPLSKWVNIAVTYNSADGSQKIYLDGIEVGGRQNLLGSGSIIPSSENLKINITSAECPNTLGHFPGYMDELSIWKTALTADEVNIMKNAKLNGTEADLISFWSFDSKDGKTFGDVKSGNIGFIYGDPVLVNSCMPTPGNTGTPSGC